MGQPKPYDLDALAVYSPESRESRKQYIDIIFQDGPIPMVGQNGAFIEDVLELIRDRLAGFNEGAMRCRENSLAITHIEEAMNWCVRRRLNRLDEGVQGSYEPHGAKP